MIRELLPIASILVLAPASFASTYVVDDNPGPGVDFTDIASAIAASVPGDVIRARAGTYQGFTLTIGVEILADAGANVTSPPWDVSIASVPAGQRATVSGLFIYSMNVTSCAGRIFLEQISGDQLFGGPPVSVAGSTDVRMRACNVSVDASSSRVEITSSNLVGREGTWGCEDPWCTGTQLDGSAGGAALVASNGAEVHVSATTLTGGHGGFGGGLAFQCPNGNGGDGGPAIETNSGATVLVTGSGTQTVRGGFPGAPGNFATCSFPDGHFGQFGAAILALGGPVVYSGVVVQGSIVGSAIPVVPADPCLVVAGSGVPGTQLTYTIYGQPGDEVRLRLGRQLIVEDVPSVYEDRLVVPLRSYALGQMPPSGQISFSINVPSTLPPNFVLIAQGSAVTPGSGDSRLTQSAPVAVR